MDTSQNTSDQTSSHRGRLVVISGPSGVGKTTIVEAVLDRTSSVFSVSATTRPPRRGEVDGEDYHFLNREDFEAKVTEGDILEWVEYGGYLYGTLRVAVDPVLRSGQSVILDIENEGAKQIRGAYENAVLIFVSPPTLSALQERLVGRGDTPESDMEVRLDVAAAQMAEAPYVYDHIVENDDLTRTIEQVLGILRSEGVHVA